MQAIVLAGGSGKRMWPLTQEIPKPMVEVAGKPLLYHHLLWLAKQGVKDVIIAAGYRAETISYFINQNDFGQLNAVCVAEQTPLGRGGAIKHSAQYLPKPDDATILSQGDIITDIPVGEAVMEHLRSATMITLVLVPYRSRFGVVEIDPAGLVRDYREKPRLPYWANTGIFVASPAFFHHLPDIGEEDATIQSLARERHVGGFRTTHYWRSVDTLKDIAEAKLDLSLPSLPHEELFCPASI